MQKRIYYQQFLKASAVFLLACGAFLMVNGKAHAQEQDNQPLIDSRNEASELVNEFQIEDLKHNAVAPDYPTVTEEMMHIITAHTL